MIAVALTAAVGLPSASRADDGGATIGNVAVEGVAATPARAGGTTRVTFTLDNRGADAVTITGLRLLGQEPSRVMASLGSGRAFAIGGLRVAPGEAESADGTAYWIEVGPLASDLVAGSVIEGRLVLGRYDAPLRVHVTPAPAPPASENRDAGGAPGQDSHPSTSGC